jgi:hypothetical protein
VNGAYHVYRCAACQTRVRINLNHASTRWDEQTGCGEGCDGTFYHPHMIGGSASCLRSGEYLGHAEVALTLEAL